MDTEFDEKRQRRRRRRIRNQIAAIIVFVAVIAAVMVGIFFGARKLYRMFTAYKQEVEEQLATEETTPVVSITDEEPIVIEAPEEEVEEETAVPTQEELLDQIVNTLISEMPLEDKVAGLFILTPEQLTGVDTAVKAGTGTQDALGTYAIGGLVYAVKNIKDEEQIKEMLKTTSGMSKYPVFMAVSESGASSTVARALSLTEVDSAKTIGQTGDWEAAATAAETQAVYLSDLGFNLNLGVDCNLSEEESSFGTDAEAVSPMVARTVEGLASNGVNSCLRFFPAKGDTASGMATAEPSEEEQAATEQVFRAGIEAGATMVCVGNISMPGLTGDNTPCDLSAAVVTSLLREQLGYDGIVITDALNEKAITEYYTSEQAALLALAAGADLLYLPEDFKAAYEGVLAAVQNQTIPEARIDTSLKRIYRVKYRNKVEDITAATP